MQRGKKPHPIKNRKSKQSSVMRAARHHGDTTGRSLCHAAFLQSAAWLTSLCQDALLLFMSITAFALWCLPQSTGGRHKPSRSGLPQCFSSTLTVLPSPRELRTLHIRASSFIFKPLVLRCCAGGSQHEWGSVLQFQQQHFKTHEDTF